MWNFIGRAGLALLKGLFTTKTGIAATAAAAGTAVGAAATTKKQNDPAPSQNEDEGGGIAGWLSKQFMKHGFGVDVEKLDWKQGAGMLVVGTAVASMGSKFLGDNMIGTVAALALGAAVAFGFSKQIKQATDGIADFFNDASTDVDQKKDAPPAIQRQQVLPAPAPTPSGP